MERKREKEIEGDREGEKEVEGLRCNLRLCNASEGKRSWVRVWN